MWCSVLTELLYITLANSIAVTIDIHLAAAQAKHAQDYSSVSVTTVHLLRNQLDTLVYSKVWNFCEKMNYVNTVFYMRVVHIERKMRWIVGKILENLGPKPERREGYCLKSVLQNAIGMWNWRGDVMGVRPKSFKILSRDMVLRHLRIKFAAALWTLSVRLGLAIEQLP